MKKIVLLMLALMLCLVGCSQNGQKTDDPADQTDKIQDSEGADQTDEIKNSPAVQEDVILLEWLFGEEQAEMILREDASCEVRVVSDEMTRSFREGDGSGLSGEYVHTVKTALRGTYTVDENEYTLQMTSPYMMITVTGEDPAAYQEYFLKMVKEAGADYERYKAAFGTGYAMEEEVKAVAKLVKNGERFEPVVDELYDEDVLVCVDEYAQGLPTIQKKYNDDGSLSTTQTYEKGKPVERLYYSNGKVSQSQIWKYDAMGNMILMEHYSENELTQRVEWEYDAGGNLLKKESRDVTANTTFAEIYEYDSEDRKIKESIYNNGTLSIMQTYEYSANGSLKKRCQYEGAAGELKEEEEYDEAGNVISRTYCSEGRKEQTYEYDSTGKKLKWYAYDENGQIRQAHEYDANGLVIKELLYEEGVVTNSYTYEYDADGNRTKRSWFVAEELYQVYEYDANGNEIKISQYEKGKLVAESVSEYDSENREIKYVQYQNGKVITRRESEYYNTGALKKRMYEHDNGTYVERLEEEYDENGYQTKDARYVNGKLDKMELRVYTAEGVCIKYTEYYEENVIFHQKEYDNEGNLSKEFFYTEGALRTIDEYSEGRLFKRSFYAAEDVLESIVDFDENENEIRRTYYDAQGNVIRVITY